MCYALLTVSAGCGFGGFGGWGLGASTSHSRLARCRLAPAFLLTG